VERRLCFAGAAGRHFAINLKADDKQSKKGAKQ
jgi:hypothetical protein